MIMRANKIITLTLLLALSCSFFSVSAAAQIPPAGSIAGMVLSSNGKFFPAETRVTLVNASNVSEEFTQFNTTVDGSGYFIFTQVPPGTYKALAWSPQHRSAYSSVMNVTANSTSSASIVLVPKPIYCIVESEYDYLPPSVSSTNIVVTVYDWWNQTVAPGLYLSIDATAGTLNPTNGTTNADGKVFTTLSRSDYGGASAEISVHYKDENGLFHRLGQKAAVKPSISPSPTPTPSPTATPSPTPTPSATPTATPTPTPTPTPTAKATPGFELAAALGAIGLITLLRRK